MTEAHSQSVIVVGGGLAGMACAVALNSRGLKVTLLEARFALGGRAGSFEDPERPGELLDNCQHVLLGCCTNLLDLYRRLGTLDKIAFHKTVHFLDVQGRGHNLWSVPAVPAPLHLGPAMALFSALTVGERTQVVRAMLAMLRLGRAGRDTLEALSFGQWLEDHRQSPAVVQKFYDPIVVSALNEETRRASAKYAIQVFQEAMLAHRRGYVVGLPACPLGELYAALPPAIDLRVNTRVEEILWEKTQNAKRKTQNQTLETRNLKLETRAVGVRLRDGTELRADAVVLATNHHAVTRWVSSLPPDALAADTRFTHLDKLESVPILGVHLWFDRPVMAAPYAAALIAGPLQWLFRKDAQGRVLHGVISAARAWTGIPKETALAQFEAQIRALFPAAGGTTLTRGVMVIEKRATFSPGPATDQFRPAQAPSPEGLQNLFLAGDYTQTGWPATMEGAVRGGYRAAQAVLTSCNINAQLVAPDLPTQWPARLMGL